MIADQQGLKYLPPDLTFFDNVRSTKDMKDFFWDHMDFEHMTEEVMKDWDMLVDREADEAEKSGEG